MSLSAYRFTRVQPHTIRGGMAAHMRDIPSAASVAADREANRAAAIRYNTIMQQCNDALAEADWAIEQARGIRANVVLDDGTRVTYYRKHIAVSFRY